MKVIDLGEAPPSLDEVIGMAAGELVVLRKPDGSMYALSQVDDFDVEVELLKNNPQFMAFLQQLSQEKPAISLDDLRKELVPLSLEELLAGVTDENLHAAWPTGPAVGKELW